MGSRKHAADWGRGTKGAAPNLSRVNEMTARFREGPRPAGNLRDPIQPMANGNRGVNPNPVSRGSLIPGLQKTCPSSGAKGGEEEGWSSDALVIAFPQGSLLGKVTPIADSSPGLVWCE